MITCFRCSSLSGSQQQQLKHLDDVISGLKKAGKATTEAEQQDPLKHLLGRVVRLVWDKDIDSKINKKLHRVSTREIYTHEYFSGMVK